jgi:DNA/RNA-binding domain of Phe-tRNA-synthetase-like protein
LLRGVADPIAARFIVDRILTPALAGSPARKRHGHIFNGGKSVGSWIDFSISPAYQARYPGVAFGLTLIAGCKAVAEGQGYEQYRRKLLRKMRKRETLAGITQRINTYDRFFQGFGFECPLPKHLKRTVNSGFPQYNLPVDAHFMAEMCAGILVAVTDHDRIEGRLTLDVARQGETSEGMGDRLFTTKEGEIVLRDEKDIICVLCQGADEKTRVKDDSRNVLFYSYAVPGIDAVYINEGLTVAAETMERFGGGTVKGLEVFQE